MAKWGATIGVILSLLPMLAYVIGGNAVFRELQTSFWTVVALYVAAGAFAGALVGLCAPFANSRLGSAMLGASIGTIFGATIEGLTYGWTHWTGPHVATAAIFGIAVGLPVGMMYRRIFADKSS